MSWFCAEERDIFRATAFAAPIGRRSKGSGEVMYAARGLSMSKGAMPLPPLPPMLLLLLLLLLAGPGPDEGVVFVFAVVEGASSDEET
jgi:hypothetical protein